MSSLREILDRASADVKAWPDWKRSADTKTERTKTMQSNQLLRSHWKTEAQKCPADSSLYTQALASRVLVLIEDIEDLEQALQEAWRCANG